MAWYNIYYREGNHEPEHFLEKAATKEECRKKWQNKDVSLRIEETDICFGITSKFEDFEDAEPWMKMMSEKDYIASFIFDDICKINVLVKALKWDYAVKVLSELKDRLTEKNLDDFREKEEILYSELLQIPLSYEEFPPEPIELRTFQFKDSVYPLDSCTFEFKDNSSHEENATLYIDDGYCMESNSDFSDYASEVRKVVLKGAFDLSDDSAATFELPNVEEFVVESTEHGYFTEEGVLYMYLNDETRNRNVIDRVCHYESWETKVLVSVPPKYPHKTFIVPEGVGAIAPSALKGTKIEKLVLPDSIDTVDGYAFYGTRYLKCVSAPKKSFGVLLDGNYKPDMQIEWRGEPIGDCAEQWNSETHELTEITERDEEEDARQAYFNGRITYDELVELLNSIK